MIALEQGRLAEAEKLLSRALEVQRRALGSHDSDTMATLNTSANDYVREGKYAQAEALFSEALEIQRRMFRSRASEDADYCDRPGQRLRPEKLRPGRGT